METHELNIEGMTCGHCVMHVERGLREIPNLTIREVRIGTAVVSYDRHAVTEESIRAAIEKSGYRLVAIL